MTPEDFRRQYAHVCRSYYDPQPCAECDREAGLFPEQQPPQPPAPAGAFTQLVRTNR